MTEEHQSPEAAKLVFVRERIENLIRKKREDLKTPQPQWDEGWDQGALSAFSQVLGMLEP